MPRASADEQPVRHRLMRAALKLFAAQGFARTTINEITSAAQVTKPMLYYYFKDKSGIFQAVMDEAYEALDVGLAEIDGRQLTASEQLAAIAELTCDLARSDPDLSRFSIAASYGPRADAPTVDIERIGMRTFQAFFDAAIAGVQRGELRGEPYEIACALYGAVQLHVMASLARPEFGLLPPGKGRKVTELLLTGFGGKGVTLPS
jgi:AcrR family transcriptional regulator